MAKIEQIPVLKNVLITCFSSLGDVAMTIPVVYPLCEANPQVRFVLATDKQKEGIFINHPANLNVLGIDMSRYKCLTGPYKLARNLQHRYYFDGVADLQNVKFTKAMASSLKRKGVTVAVIDKGEKEKQRLISGKTREPVKSTHERYRTVFEQLGLKTGNDFINIFDNGKEPRSPLVPSKSENERWIAIAPFAQHQGKMYPLEQMQLVIAELARWESVHILLFGGGEKEKEAFDSIMRRYTNVISLPHIKHTFADELLMMRRCDVMLTMDSANMHLASLVELPVVSMWGPTHPSCSSMGWGQATKDTVQLNLECRPCSVDGKKKCRYGDWHCMTDISPELIIEKIKRVLDR